MSTEPIAHLVCNDGVIITTTQAVARQSETARDLIDDLSDSDEVEIDLREVDSVNFRRCLIYMTQMAEDDTQLHTISDTIPYTGHAVNQTDWEKAFLRGDLPEGEPLNQAYYRAFFPLLTSANYLAVKPLVRVIATEIASSFLNKKEEEICALYGIKEKLTAEQKEKVLEENKWHEER